MNLEPEIWGPHFWLTLHFISSTYSNSPNQSVKSAMKSFIQTLPMFLPCKECQDHAFQHIKKSNLNKIVQNRKELFTFFFNFHNNVNQRLNKPLMTIENALIKYRIPKEEHHLYSYLKTMDNLSTIRWNFLLLIVGILIIVLIR